MARWLCMHWRPEVFFFFLFVFQNQITPTNHASTNLDNKMWRAVMSKRMHEIQFNFCPKSPSSAGLRNWIHKNYTDLKKLNPRLPFLVRDFEGIEPFITAQYGKCIASLTPTTDFKSLRIQVSNLSEEEVEQKIIEFVQLSDPETHPEDHPYKATWFKNLDQDNVDGIRGVDDRVIRLK